MNVASIRHVSTPAPGPDWIRTWVAGGVFLLLAGGARAVEMLVPQAPQWPIVSAALMAIGVWIFAIGFRARESVVRRRPIGMIALIVYGLWPLLYAAVVQHFVSGGLESLPEIALYMSVGALAAVVGVIAIVVADVVPRPWRWAPLWGLVAVTVPIWSVGALFTYWIGFDGYEWVFVAFHALDALVPAALGILAIALGMNPAPVGSTPVSADA